MGTDEGGRDGCSGRETKVIELTSQSNAFWLDRTANRR
jgi:hypothetical protein